MSRNQVLLRRSSMSPSRIAGSVSIVAALTCAINAMAQSNDQIPFPSEYRQWAHVKSVLVGPESPAFPTEGGIHHVYANPKGVEGYRTGTFPDGSVVVYNLLEVKTADGATIEGAARRVDVMVKDSRRFPETGGWGFARFKPDNWSESMLTADAQRSCFACHAKRKVHDAVFSEFRK
jgi:Cytochrome P460